MKRLSALMILTAVALWSQDGSAQTPATTVFGVRVFPQATSPISGTDNGIWANSGNLNHLTEWVGAGRTNFDLTSIPSSYYNVKAYGAKGDNVTDDTAAVQAAVTACEAAKGGTVYFPTGEYIITSTITMHRGTFLQGGGTQGSNQNYGTSIVHNANNTNLFVWDGNGPTGAAGTGGGMADFFIAKGLGFSGGDAIYVVSTDDNHRPGEMRFVDILIASEGTALWSRDFHVDGTASNIPGGRGVRSIYLEKFRTASCDGVGFPDECIYLSQPTHLYGYHVQLDPGVSTGSFGITLDQNWDQVYFFGIECNGTFVVSQPPDATYTPNLMVVGRVGTAFQQNSTTAEGKAEVITASLVNNSSSFDSKKFADSATTHENWTNTGTFTLSKNGPSNSVDTSLTLQENAIATVGSPVQRSLGMLLTSQAYNPTSGLAETQNGLIQMIPASATPTSGILGFFTNSNNAGYVEQAFISTDGDFVSAGDLWTKGTSGGNGTVHALVFNPSTAGIGNFCTSTNCTAESIGNTSANMLIAAAVFDLTRITSILGTPTWTNGQTFPSLTVNGAFTEQVATSNAINTSNQFLTTTTASVGTPVARSPGVVLGASVWDTGALAAQTDQFLVQTTGTSQSGIAGTLLFASNLNGAGWVTQMSITSAGDTVHTGKVFAGGGNGTGVVQAGSVNPAASAAMSWCTSANCTATTLGRAGIQITEAGSVQVTQGFAAGYRTASSTVTVAATDSFIGVSGTGARTVNLPAASAVKAGAYIVIQDVGNSAGAITVNPSGTDNINSVNAAVSIAAAFGRKWFVSDGSTNWYVDANLI